MSVKENTSQEKKLQPGESRAETPLEKLSKRKKKAETVTHAETRADIEKFMKKEDLARLHEIERQKAEKKEEMVAKQRETQGKTASRTSFEPWADEPEESGITSGFVESGIESKVDEKFDQYMGKIKEYGITDDLNIKRAKQAAKEIIYEHYQKTGNEINDITIPWLKNELSPKLKTTLTTLQEVLKKPGYENMQPAKLLEEFCTWSGLNFVQKGILQVEPLKNFLRMKKEVVFGMVQSFIESIELKEQIAKLEGEAANLVGKKIDIGTMFREGRITATMSCRLELKSDGTINEETSTHIIEQALPSNLDPEIRSKVVEYLLSEAKKITVEPGQTLELETTGEWKKVDPIAEQKEEEDAKEAAKKETSTAEKEEEEEPIDTGYPALDRFLTSIRNFFKKIAAGLAPVYAKVKSFGKPPEEEEFANLTDDEKTVALAFKEALKTSGANMETMKPLLKNDREIRKILKQRKEKHITWKKFLEENISDEEKKKLASTEKLKAEEIAEMLLS